MIMNIQVNQTLIQNIHNVSTNNDRDIRLSPFCFVFYIKKIYIYKTNILISLKL